MQRFEPRLTAQLCRRWPDRVTQVLAYDEERSWLLTADAGAALGPEGNRPEVWLKVLPRYAEFQRGEVSHAADHAAHGVPSLPVESLPARYAELLEQPLPLTPAEIHRLRGFQRRFGDLCTQLAAFASPASVQHDDLHMANVYVDDGAIRVLDWGDSSISHPFFSLVATFRSLEEYGGLHAGDPWFTRLRDAYLEPWGSDKRDQLELALKVGAFAHPLAWMRQREFLAAAQRTSFDVPYAQILRRALATV